MVHLESKAVANVAAKSNRKITMNEAHLLLGHISDERVLKSLAMSEGLSITDHTRMDCVTCQVANSTRQPHPDHRSSPLASQIGD
jgi:hypothetical protein